MPKPKAKRAVIRAETRQGDFVTRQCSSTCYKTCENLLGSAKMESIAAPVVFTEHSPFRLSLISFDGTWLGCAALPFLYRYQKMGLFLDSLKRRRILFRRGIHLLPERWEEIVVSDRQYFEWHISYHIS